MCGKLFCTGGKDMPRDGSMVVFESCKASFPRNGEVDSGMILDGTKCGNGMVSKEKLFFLFFFPLLSVLLISLALLPDKKDFKQRRRLNWTLNCY